MSNKINQEYRKRKADLVRLLKLYKKKKKEAQRLLAKLKKKVIGINKLELKDHARNLVKLYKKLIIKCKEKLLLLENTLHEETKKLHLKISPAFLVVTAFIFLGVLLFLNQTTLTGLAVTNIPKHNLQISPVQIEFISNDYYVWAKNWTGNLSSMKISGKFIGAGSAKLYLGDKLILDSDKLPRPTIIADEVAIASAQMAEQLANLQSNATLNETNITSENVTLENTTETKEVELSFSDLCLETCNLDLDNEVYQIKAQVENAKIVIDSITYTTVKNTPEIVPEVVNVTLPLNLTPSIVNTTNVTNIATVNITQVNVSEVNVTKVRIKEGKKHFKTDETPSFDFDYDDKDSIPVTVRKGQEFKVGSESVQVVIIDGSGKISRIKGDIIKTASKRFRVDIPKQREFKPGRYVIRIEQNIDENTTNIEEYDFTWGVLALNTHKSIYLPNEQANIGIAVLDDTGHMVCDDAKVTLSIIDPFNLTTVLSTANGKIKVSPECKTYGVTKLPDYYTDYLVGSTGTYLMNLTAIIGNGIRSISDSFEVRNAVDFDVSRDGPTRTYPPATYSMNFTIKANKNFNGKIKDFVPLDFEVLSQSGLKVNALQQEKELVWDVNLKTGETKSLSYNFRTGQESPYLYLLGPLEIGNQFKELRSWMIASDQPDNFSIIENFYGAGGALPAADIIANWSAMQYNGSVTLAGTRKIVDNQSTLVTTAAGMASGNATSATVEAGAGAINGSIFINMTSSGTDDNMKYGYSVNYSKIASGGIVSINGTIKVTGNATAAPIGHNISFKVRAAAVNAQIGAAAICVKLTGTFCATVNRLLYICGIARGNGTSNQTGGRWNSTFNDMVPAAFFDKANVKIANTTGILTANTWTTAINQSIISLIRGQYGWGATCNDYNISTLQIEGRIFRTAGTGVLVQTFNLDELLIYNASVNTAPTLTAAAINYTNATLTRTGEQINTSVTVTDPEGGAQYFTGTAALFINSRTRNNLTLIQTTSTLSSSASGNTISIVFNATNITKNDAIYVEWNVTDGVTYSNPINSTAITVNDTVPVLSAASINYTNATLFLTGETINASITVADADNENVYTTVALYRNRTLADFQQIPLTVAPVGGKIISIIFNATNVTNGMRIEVQFNSTSTGNSNDAAYLNVTAITVNNSAPTGSSATINYTNATLTKTGEQINASILVQDLEGNLTYGTAALFVNSRIFNNLSLAQVQTTPGVGAGSILSIIFNATNITKNDAIYVEWNLTDGSSYSSTYTDSINSTAITVNDTTPVLSAGQINYTNLTLNFSGETINASITVADADNENVYTTVALYRNRTLADFQQIPLTVAPVGGKIISIIFNATNVSKNMIIGVQFNSTSTTNSNDAAYFNATEVTVNDTNPLLSNSAINETNATLFTTAEYINASVTITDVDNENNYITAILFVNRVPNLTLQIGTVNIGSAGRSISIVFNNTNITANDVVTMQFNSTSTGNSNDATYDNATAVTAQQVNTAPLASSANINYTNTTFTKAGKFINASISVFDAEGDLVNGSVALYTNNSNKRYLIESQIVGGAPTGNGRNISIEFNNTNITKGSQIYVEWNVSDAEFSTGPVNSSIITVNDSNLTLASAAINYTNLTLNFSGDFINASVSVTDPDQYDLANTTVILFVNRVPNLTLEIINSNTSTGTRIISIIFNNTNITKNQVLEMQFNSTSDGNTVNAFYLNATAITVNDTPPSLSAGAINYTNLTLNFSGDFINASVNIADVDNEAVYTTAILFVNRVQNLTLQIDSFTTTATGRIVSIIFNNTNITKNQVVTLQFNGTSTSNSNDGTYYNATDITVNDTNPVLSAGAINYTNITLTRTGEQINASVNIADVDNEAVYTTAILFVNRVQNLTLQIDSFTTTATGRIVSIIFNNTNITKNQVIGVQFNSTSTGNSNDAVYTNTTDVYVNDTNLTLSSASLNYTNATISVTGEDINTSVTITDLDSNDDAYTTAILFINRKENLTLQIPTTIIPVGGRSISIVFNDTNITANDVINIQFNSTSSGNSVTAYYENSTAITVPTSNTGPYIGNISVRDTLTITENTFVPINISFLVHDDQGTADINAGYTRLNVTNNGTTPAVRLNNSCTSIAINAFVLNFSCTVDMWYFDVPGTWNITVEVKDSVNVINVTNRSHSATGISKDFFTVADTTAIVLSPASLTFSSVTPGADNVTAQQNITINNTANHNSSTLGNIQLTAVNLRGTNPAYLIPAANFTINTSSGGSPPFECNYGASFTNNTATTITNSTLGPGNRSFGAMEGTEAFFICLYDTPDNLTGQTYSATGVNAWTITVN